MNVQYTAYPHVKTKKPNMDSLGVAEFHDNQMDSLGALSDTGPLYIVAQLTALSGFCNCKLK